MFGGNRVTLRFSTAPIRMTWYDVHNIAFELLGYPLSYVELIGTLFGLFAVALAARGNIWTWPASIVNEVAFFLLFFQVRLYADMFLQVYFFVVTLYGWYYWAQGRAVHPVTRLSQRTQWSYAGIWLAGTGLVGYLISNLHLFAPNYFPEPAAYPYADAFTTVGSILAMILLSRRKIENWYLWMLVDVVAVVVYYLKGIQLVALEYVVFFLLCVQGWYHWRKELGA